MSAIRRILCPTDFSDGSRHAFDHALAIAQWRHAAITLFHARAPIPVIAYATGVPMMPSELLTRDDRPEILATLKEFASREAPANARVELKIGEGHAAAEIVAAAEAARSDLIVMGSHGRSGFERFVLGSVTERVLRKAACPVLTVPPRAPDAVPYSPVLYKHIVCAVDFSPCSLGALEHATSLAREANARLTVMHVIELPPSLLSGGYMLAGSHSLKEYLVAAEAEAGTLLKNAVPESLRPDATVRTVVAVGRAYTEILRVAAETPTDLIVIGVQGRGAADLLFFGSTVQHVVRQATCPVLTLRAA